MYNNKRGSETMEKELDYTALGIKIRQTRKKHHVTQEQLGEICELSTAHIGHIERFSELHKH